MSKADQLIDRAANRLEELAAEQARKGGLGAKLAEPLAEDADFLRKLKPTLIAARARGRAPTNQEPRAARPAAPAAPQLGPRAPKKTKAGRKAGGPNPWLVAGVALAAGIALAKVVDWRGHAHPRD
jgi:hypothetical protein